MGEPDEIIWCEPGETFAQAAERWRIEHGAPRSRRREGKMQDRDRTDEAWCAGYAAGLEAAAKFVEDRYKCQDAKAATWFGDAIRALNEDTPDVDA